MSKTLKKETGQVLPNQELSNEDKKEVKKIETVFENKALAPQDAFGKLSKSQLDLIKRTIAKGATDDELRLFIQVCRGANLNPFLKQVFFVKRWNSKTGQEEGAIQVSIDGFRSIAESSENYAGNEDPIFTEEKEIEVGKDKKKVTVPLKATVTVYKMIGGQRCPFTASARWTEYYPGERMGFQWHSKPYLMLGKCAEALALRKGFPKLLSGMYVQEEMDKVIQIDSDSEKQQKNLKTIVSAIESQKDVKALKDFSEKIKKSEKYTEDQKIELILMIDEKISKLAQNTPNSA